MIKMIVLLTVVLYLGMGYGALAVFEGPTVWVTVVGLVVGFITAGTGIWASKKWGIY